MDRVTELEDQLASPIREPAHEDPAIRHKHDVSSLQAHRGDLRGVYAFADVVEESVRWSA